MCWSLGLLALANRTAEKGRGPEPDSKAFVGTRYNGVFKHRGLDFRTEKAAYGKYGLKGIMFVVVSETGSHVAQTDLKLPT